MSATDPPVRSIRIATTLAERFRDILTFTGLTDTATLELRIGEAQQIYPEIWRHPDEAHPALVDRGLLALGIRKLAMSSETTDQAHAREERETDEKFREERAVKRAADREARKAAYAKEAADIKTDPAKRQARIRELTRWLVAHPC